MAYDTRQITHGTQEVTYGLSGDGTGAVTYSTGVQKFSPSVDQDSKKIYALLAAIDCGSLTAAAEKLGYTQSGLTHMMNSLENELGLNLLVRSEYTLSGSFDRNAFFVEGVSGLKYRCGVSGALPLGFAESARYPQAALERMPSLIEKQQKQIAMLQHEIPTLQEITARKWSKAEELERLKQGCKELQQRIDEALKEAERPQSEVPEEENTVRAA